MARSTCLPFSRDWYSSKSAITWRIIAWAGSSPSSWVIGNQPHADLRELADIHLQPEGIAEEAGVRVDNDDVERMIVVAGPLDHALEFSAIIVGRGGTSFDIPRSQLPAAGQAERFDLPGLIRNGEIRFCLPAGADPVIATAARADTIGDLAREG